MKKRMLELTLLAMTLTAFSFSAQAWEGEALQETLKEAMMESNADYNRHKLKVMTEENNRIDDWDNRDSHSIIINEKNHSFDTSDFSQPADNEDELQELSSNNND